MKFKKVTILFAVMLMALVGCDKGGSDSISVQQGEAGLNTSLTDELRLTKSYENKKFTLASDGIGVVKFRSHTDGDTTNFNAWVGKDDGGNDVYEYIKVRYLGVNTPESTARIEPWGLRASKYTKNIVSNAKLLVLENYIDIFGQMDNKGTRYLGFVWYSMDGVSPLRLLNLELVEMAYSLNQIQKTDCPYYEYFVKAERKARATEAHIYGQVDPEYDYTNTVVTCSIHHLLNHYNEYGVVLESIGEEIPASSGKQLRVTGIVIGVIGDNLVIRDLQRDIDQKDDEPLASIYAYAGYNTSLGSVIGIGDVIRFYCKLTKFNDTMQLSDVVSSMNDLDRPFQRLMKGLTGPTDERSTIDDTVDFSHIDMSLVELDETTVAGITDYSQLSDYAYKIVKTRITTRSVTVDDKDEDGNVVGSGFQGFIKKSDETSNHSAYTVYGSLKAGKTFPVCNIRVDASQNPYISPDGDTIWKLDHTYECIGYLAPYFDKYQLQLLNNTNQFYGTYVVDVTENA